MAITFGPEKSEEEVNDRPIPVSDDAEEVEEDAEGNPCRQEGE